MRTILVRQWFLLGLAIVLTVGLWAPNCFACLVDMATVRNGIVAVVMFVTAFPLDTRTMWGALRRPWAALLATALNFVMLPLVAWAVSPLLRGDLAIGLLVMAAAPCTLASAAVWTRRAGGNDAVAILVTVITNASCFVVTPLWLVATTGREVEINLTEMIAKLVYLVVLPMVVAQLLRLHPSLGHLATSRKALLSLVAQVGILAMVFIGAVKCGLSLAAAAGGQYELSAVDSALMLGAVLGVHLLVLTAGLTSGELLRFSRADRIAVGLAGSQKSLMVGLHVALTYYGGLTILPMVAYHVGQLLLDTLIADFLRRTPTVTKPAE